MPADVQTVHSLDCSGARHAEGTANDGAPSADSMLRALYAAYNRHDADALLAHLSPDIDWPDGADRLHGHAAVRAYWRAQWDRVQTHDTVTGIARLADDRWSVGIDQTVRGHDGPILSVGRFEHRYRVADGLVGRLDIRPL